MNIAARAGHKVLAITLLTLATPLLAQTPDLSRNVQFQVGDTYFLDGDTLTVTSIKGPTDTIAIGNTYLVTGTYKLTSHPDALLSSNVTTRVASGPTSNHDPKTQPRNEPIQHGDGTFSVYLHMDTDGYPHISLYPTGGGSSFAGIYFGTGTTLMKPHNRPAATPPATDSVSQH